MNKASRPRKIGFVSHLFAVVIAFYAVASPHASEQTLMLYGDSLMAGYGLSPEQSFAGQLQAALGEGVQVVNVSVSGSTSSDGLERLERSLLVEPDAVILGLGANDMLRGHSVATLRENLATILKRFETDGVPVLLAGMRATPNHPEDYAAEFNAVYPELAEEFGIDLYPFFLEGVAGDANLNQRDGIHPNATGVRIIVNSMISSVRAVLQN